MAETLFIVLKNSKLIFFPAQSYVLLGDAYMSIQEPERALEIYEQALRRSPKDAQLRAKMGQVRRNLIASKLCDSHLILA